MKHPTSPSENGHYVAIHCLDNAYWYADDEQYPVPLPYLSEEHKQQIVQVWLTLDSADELVPDTLEAWEPALQKKQRCHYETLHLPFANVTNFGRKVQDWVWAKTDHLLFLQETHMGTKALEATGNGGNTGGFLTLHGQRHLAHHVQTYTQLQRAGTLILITQAYLRTGETLQSPRNAIGGDWQNSPDALAATVIMSKFN